MVVVGFLGRRRAAEEGRKGDGDEQVCPAHLSLVVQGG